MATYYVDYTGGSDSNDGLSTGAAWKTINKVNTSSFSADDQILFKKGEVWRETLTVPSSGTSGHPITFGAYGTGADPIISGADVLTTWTQGAGTPVVAEQQATTTGGADVDVYSPATPNIYESQGFKSATEIVVPYVDIWLKKEGSPTGNVSFEIWASSGGDPSGANPIATTGTIDVSTISTSASWVRFTFSSPPTLAANTVYHLKPLVTYAASSTVGLVWYVNTSDLYRNGEGDPFCRIRLNDNGPPPTQQAVFATHDTAFKIFKNVAGGTYYYKSGITTEPNQVFYDGVRLTQNDGATSSVGVNEWDWAANVLHINVGEDPAGGVVEASQRGTCITIGQNKNYVTIDGIQAEKGNDEGLGNIHIFGENTTVRNCEVHYGINHGIRLGNYSRSCLIEYNNITYNGRVMGDCAGIYVWNDLAAAGTENTIRYNTLDYNVVFGINIISSYCIVEHNDIGLVGGNGNISQTTGANGIEIFNDGTGLGSHNIVRYNRVTNQLSGGDNGEGIDCDDNSSYNQVYYNICWNNDGPGYTNWRGNNNSFWNNVAYGNCQNSSGSLNSKYEFHVGALASGTTDNLVFKNNILVATMANTYAIGLDSFTYNSSGLNITNNCYSSSATNWYFWNSSGGNNLATWNALTGIGTDINDDPEFTNAASADFSLQASSPCINAGVDVGLTEDYLSQPLRNPPSMGAYQFKYQVSNKLWWRNKK